MSCSLRERGREKCADNDNSNNNNNGVSVTMVMKHGQA